MISSLRWSIALALTAVVLAPTARGEDDGWVDIVEEPKQQNDWIVQPEQFDNWVFQTAQSVEGQRDVFGNKLDLALEQLGQSCTLTEAQELKLRLAGQMEIERYFQRYNQVKDHYIKTKPGQDEFNEVWQMIQPLQQAAQAGLFGADSLVSRVARGTLDPEQLAAHRRLQNQRRAYRYRALIQAYVMMLEEHLPLTTRQREGLIGLIEGSTLPPNRFGETDQYYIMHQASTVRRHEIVELLEGPVGEGVANALQTGRGYESHLESQGVRPYREDDE
ncbi:hypothetical protein KOR34_20590 [Posidoniimonas corsicana]|uniref:Uncharacterized protein n=1 Tax=Posidoniimonas corsicana TaxID=1938618 RepID=A0A5C5VHG2_9BACT|nr:hypothetical protein [Posidoniimonas corsicana]TWT37112.1 hypothetical protein KOR34_20590 [Posidoniimonas corsicana]